MPTVDGAPRLAQLLSNPDYRTPKGEKHLVRTLREGLWYHDELGVVRLDVDSAKRTVTVRNGETTRGPFALDGLAASELAASLSELRGQTSAHAVSDGYDALGRETHPSTLGGIQALIRGLDRELRERAQVAQLHREVKAEVEAADGKAGFRERHLRGWFGGDGELTEKLRVLTDQQTKIAERANSEGADVDALRARIDEAVARHLASADPAFKKLRVEAAAAGEFASAASALVSALKSAIEECEEGASAKHSDATTDGLSAVFGDKGVVGMMDRIDDFTSSMEVDEAKSALRRLSAAFESYQAAGKRYANLREGPGASAGASGGIDRIDGSTGDMDFWVDTVFDMDLFGMFTASSIASDLDNAAEKMRRQEPGFVKAEAELKTISAALASQERERIDAHRAEIAAAPAEAPPAPPSAKHPMLRTHGA